MRAKYVGRNYFKSLHPLIELRNEFSIDFYNIFNLIIVRLIIINFEATVANSQLN